MKPVEREQLWTIAYAFAFAVTALGSEIRGVRNSPEDIDARARKLADRASDAIVERVEKAERTTGRAP